MNSSRTRIRAKIYVFLQYSLLLIFLFTGSLVAENPVLLAIEIAGIVLGFWAILAMKIGNLHISPIVNKSATLVISGPYRVIRHPMYTAIALTYLPLVIDDPNLLRIIIYILLFFTLIVKMLFEETLLNQSFIEYSAYMKKSYRMIPFIF